MSSINKPSKENNLRVQKNAGPERYYPLNIFWQQLLDRVDCLWRGTKYGPLALGRHLSSRNIWSKPHRLDFLGGNRSTPMIYFLARIFQNDTQEPINHAT